MIHDDAKWTPLAERPTRSAAKAEQAMGTPQRVLSIVGTTRTLSAEHRIVMRDGQPPVRLEIAEGVKKSDAIALVARMFSLMGMAWPALIDPAMCLALSKSMEGKDFRIAAKAASEKADRPQSSPEQSVLRGFDGFQGIGSIDGGLSGL